MCNKSQKGTEHKHVVQWDLIIKIELQEPRERVCRQEQDQAATRRLKENMITVGTKNYKAPAMPPGKEVVPTSHWK